MAEPDKSPSDPAQKKVLIAVGLIGVNIVCLAALIGASLLPAPLAPEAAAPLKAEHASASASATPTAEAKASAEPAAAVEAKATAEPAMAAASAAPSASAAADAPKGGGTHAVVKLGPARQKGVVRFKPEPKARLVVVLPAGTAVDVTDKTTVGKQVWYQVKTIDFKRPTTGWMVGEVLKME